MRPNRPRMELKISTTRILTKLDAGSQHIALHS